MQINEHCNQRELSVQMGAEHRGVHMFVVMYSPEMWRCQVRQRRRSRSWNVLPHLHCLATSCRCRVWDWQARSETLSCSASGMPRWVSASCCPGWTPSYTSQLWLASTLVSHCQLLLPQLVIASTFW